jgi:peptidoglycan/LPS O-acetylase OafA/YrhL
LPMPWPQHLKSKEAFAINRAISCFLAELLLNTFFQTASNQAKSHSPQSRYRLSFYYNCQKNLGQKNRVRSCVSFFSMRDRALNHPSRIEALDYWRALAILTVVFYHFEKLPFGYLGVDLFFVLSGFLVSRVLLQQTQVNGEVARNFVISRGFKIWPSYYFFFLIGSIICSRLYSTSHPELAIHGNDWWKYLFFYQNYRGTNHFVFDHVWSLCVEEHFYLLLPLGFWLRIKFFPNLPVIAMVIIAIFAGNLFRTIGYFIHFETFSATHNNIGALSWGVLLAVITNCGQRNIKFKLLWLGSGIALLAGSIFFLAYSQNEFYENVIFHGLTALAFFLLIGGSLSFRNQCLSWLKYISYYSYNWYLWHVLGLFAIRVRFGTGFLGTAIFVLSGFFLAFIAVHLIEENGLKLRARWRNAQNSVL